MGKLRSSRLPELGAGMLNILLSISDIRLTLDPTRIRRTLLTVSLYYASINEEHMWTLFLASGVLTLPYNPLYEESTSSRLCVQVIWGPGRLRLCRIAHDNKDPARLRCLVPEKQADVWSVSSSAHAQQAANAFMSIASVFRCSRERVFCPCCLWRHCSFSPATGRIDFTDQALVRTIVFPGVMLLREPGSFAT